MEKIQFTGDNVDDVKAFCGEGCMVSTYFGMGFTMLSIFTSEGILTVNEGDFLSKDENGNLSIV